MRDFHSAKLARDFPLIYFASRVSRGGEPLPAVAAEGGLPAPDGQTMPSGHPPVGAGTSASPISVTEVIPPAAGGHSVADLWARRTVLDRQDGGRARQSREVPRRGSWGSNWVRLQDGTGSALKDGTSGMRGDDHRGGEAGRHPDGDRDARDRQGLRCRLPLRRHHRGGDPVEVSRARVTPTGRPSHLPIGARHPGRSLRPRAKHPA